MKTKNKLILMLILLSGVFYGCSDYLDVTPKDKQTQEQLFGSRSGFYAAVNGVYNKLPSTALYGRNLSYEMIDLLALRYNPVSTSGTMISATVGWTYTNDNLKSTLTSVWSTAYNTILNCNVILDNLDKQQGLLTEKETNLLRGEMLALRAFLHFDMLRLFGPIYKVNPKAAAIPYNESVKVTNLPLLPADSVIFHKILRDLGQAEKYLAEDPVLTEGPLATAPEDGEEVYLRYRQLRFNYYAVLALEARVYLYGQDKENARLTALKLIQDPAVKAFFPAVDPAKLLGNSQTPDRVFSTEVLMGMYKKARADIYTYSFEAENAGTGLLQPRIDYVNSMLFVGESGDYRMQSQWAPATGLGATGYIFTKYRTLKFPDPNNTPFYATFMPLIRLSEMYYIAAECEKEVKDGYAWLNEIRQLRGVPVLPIVDAADLMKYIRTEYLREFYGEGQAFFMYKRMNASILKEENGYNNNTYTCTAARFVPPLPEDEIANR